MILKRGLILFGALAMIVAFQNCNFQEFGTVDGKSVSEIDHFLVEIETHPYAQTGHKYTTRIEASLDIATGTDGLQLIAKNRFLISKRVVEAGKSGACTTIFSVNRDDIRVLFKDIQEARVTKAISPATAHIADKALYNLSFNYGPKILLSNMNYKAGDYYTSDIGLKNFEEALSQLSAQVISSGCSDEKGESIDTLMVDIVSHPYAQAGYEYTTRISAQVEYLTGHNGQHVKVKDRFIIRKETMTSGENRNCTTTYVTSRDSIKTLLAKAEGANIILAKEKSNAFKMDSAMYNIKINSGPEVLMESTNYEAGSYYTTDIGLKDFETAIKSLDSSAVLSFRCN